MRSPCTVFCTVFRGYLEPVVIKVSKGGMKNGSKIDL